MAVQLAPVEEWVPRKQAAIHSSGGLEADLGSLSLHENTSVSEQGRGSSEPSGGWRGPRPLAQSVENYDIIGVLGGSGGTGGGGGGVGNSTNSGSACSQSSREGKGRDQIDYQAIPYQAGEYDIHASGLAVELAGDYPRVWLD